MEIQQTRIVLKARNFDLTNRFYEQVLGFPRLNNWESTAKRLREDPSLSEPLRRAALNRVLRRATDHP